MAISGGAIESLFDYEVMNRGYVVSAPRTDASQYDRIVDTKNKLYRVQIKARRGNGQKSFMIKINKSQYAKYTIADTDIIALYIEDNNSWYIFPVEECPTFFRYSSRKEKMVEYKNNWCIIK